MAMDEQDWKSFKQKLKSKTEIDLDLYKEPQMIRINLQHLLNILRSTYLNFSARRINSLSSKRMLFPIL